MPLFDFSCPDGHAQTDVMVAFDGKDAPKYCTESVPIDPSLGSMLGALVEGTFVAGTRFCNKPLTKLVGAPSAFPGAADWRR